MLWIGEWFWTFMICFLPWFTFLVISSPWFNRLFFSCITRVLPLLWSLGTKQAIQLMVNQVACKYDYPGNVCVCIYQLPLSVGEWCFAIFGDNYHICWACELVCSVYIYFWEPLTWNDIFQNVALPLNLNKAKSGWMNSQSLQHGAWQGKPLSKVLSRKLFLEKFFWKS